MRPGSSHPASRGEFLLDPKSSWAGWCLSEIFITRVSLKIATEHISTPYILTFSFHLSFSPLCPNFHKDKRHEAGVMAPSTLQPVWTGKFLTKLCKQTKHVSKHRSGERSHKEGGERNGSSAFLSSVEPTREHHLSQQSLHDHCAQSPTC